MIELQKGELTAIFDAQSSRFYVEEIPFRLARIAFFAGKQYLQKVSSSIEDLCKNPHKEVIIDILA
jgi:hypothetical protein